MTLSHSTFRVSLAVVFPLLFGLASPTAASREATFQDPGCPDHCPATPITLKAPTNACCIIIYDLAGTPTDGTHQPESCLTCSDCTRYVRFLTDESSCWGGSTYHLSGPAGLDLFGSGEIDFSMTLHAKCRTSSVPLTLTVYHGTCSDTASETVTCNCDL